MFCSKCGTKAIEGADFCQKCGAKLIKDKDVAQELGRPTDDLYPDSVEMFESDSRENPDTISEIHAPIPLVQQPDIVPPKTLYNKPRNFSKHIAWFVGVVVIVVAMAVIVLLLKSKPKYPDELLYDGLPASRFLEMTQEDIDLEFGQSGNVFQNQNKLTGSEYFNYSDHGIDHVTYSRETGEVIYVELWSHYCSFNGKKLDLTAETALERVLSEGDFFGGPIEVYGSICSGFYYDDAVYFSDTNDYVQWKQQQVLDNNTSKSDYQIYTIDKHEDYKIGMITYSIYNSDEYEVRTFALYTDEWVNYVEESSADGNIVTAPDTIGVGTDTTDQILLCGIPLGEVIGMPSSDIYANFGDSVDWSDDYMQYGIHGYEGFSYFDDGWIEFNMAEYSVAAFSSDPLNLTYNGQNLAQDFNALVTILGDSYIFQGETTSSWWAAWYSNGHEISFEFLKDAEGPAPNAPFSVFVSPIT